jgi:hypothetical protein
MNATGPNEFCSHSPNILIVNMLVLYNDRLFFLSGHLDLFSRRAVSARAMRQRRVRHHHVFEITAPGRDDGDVDRTLGVHDDDFPRNTTARS